MGAGIAQGKIFVIKGQPVVKSRYIPAPMNYFDSNRTNTATVLDRCALGEGIICRSH